MDEDGKILINFVPLHLLSNVHGVGNTTINNLDLLKRIGLEFSLENAVHAFASNTFFNKEKIVNTFSFRSVRPMVGIDSSQSEPCMAQDHGNSGTSRSRSCVDTIQHDANCVVVDRRTQEHENSGNPGSRNCTDTVQHDVNCAVVDRCAQKLTQRRGYVAGPIPTTVTTVSCMDVDTLTSSLPVAQPLNTSVSVASDYPSSEVVSRVGSSTVRPNENYPILQQNILTASQGSPMRDPQVVVVRGHDTSGMQLMLSEINNDMGQRATHRTSHNSNVTDNRNIRISSSNAFVARNPNVTGMQPMWSEINNDMGQSAMHRTSHNSTTTDNRNIRTSSCNANASAAIYQPTLQNPPTVVTRGQNASITQPIWSETHNGMGQTFTHRTAHNSINVIDGKYVPYTSNQCSSRDAEPIQSVHGLNNSAIQPIVIDAPDTLPVRRSRESQSFRQCVPKKFEQTFKGGNGDIPWDVFLWSFKSYLKLMGVDSFELSMHCLRNALKQDALSHLMSLEALNISNIETIYSKMEERFGTSAVQKMQLAQIEIESLAQKQDESAECWASRVLETYRKAFPECDIKTLERLAVSKFCIGLIDSSASLLMSSQQYGSLSDALYALSRIQNHKLATANRPHANNSKPRTRVISCEENEAFEVRNTSCASQEWRPAFDRLEKKFESEVKEIKELIKNAHVGKSDESTNFRGRSNSPHPKSFGSRSRTPTPSRGPCHNCGQTGHWIRDCPSKSPKVSFKEESLKGKESTK